VLQKAVAKPGDAGFRVDLTVGGAIPEKTQSFGLSVGQSADLQQALLSYILPVGTGLRLDFGKFVTHMGYEVIEGYDGYNDNYSRSFLFNYAIPFTHTGAKVTYARSERLSAMLMVVNGWDNVRDNNSGKSVGAQLTLVPVSPLTVYLNYIGGPEKTDTSGFRRNTFDVVANWKVLKQLTLGVNGDYGVESGASLTKPGDDAVWKGIAGYARYDVTNRFTLALRGETLRDEGGTRLGTGAAATVTEATLTPTCKFTDRFLFRGDVRFDRSNRDIFVKRGGARRDSQTTFAGNVIFVY
jgi:Putative beta-barrel porin-2, OmpL-like. bbp2